ncbi:MAG: AcrB/AcrD/AcrF family protein [Gammaproteobacteria bacterium]|nr:MAG: AcrB/AcrD/AcrF family protein [Gammaproteobacteria bacterium]RLA49948.1 MAG: AcrB/AcrD/AcrF family protein [Gammaproteobacteria bacterium]
MSVSLGVAGRISQAFVQSALTPLILVIAVVLGGIALSGMPREEEPQITVPFVDILVSAPGLRAEDIVELVTKPFEDILKGIDNVAHIYSMTRDDGLAITVRFDTGHDDDSAIARINDAIDANKYRLPQNIPEPLVIGRSIDDVAVIVLTLSAYPGNEGRWTTEMLTELAEELNHELIKVDDVGLTYIVGGHPKEIRVEPDPELLSLYGVTLNQVVEKVRNANRAFLTGSLRHDDRAMTVIAGQTLQGATDIGLLVITTFDGRPVYMRDVAKIVTGASLDDHSVRQMLPVQDENGNKTFKSMSAVSLAIAKRKGANGVEISKDVLKRLELIRGRMIPDEVKVEVTRDYGATAEHKANELMGHLLLATAAIVIIMALFLGWREGLVILVVIPATVLLTFFVCWLLDISLNRLTMFGIIFAIAILADDAIVVIENISRHWKMLNGRSWKEATIDAVAEVGNPTIIATFTVVAAMLPMLYSTGFNGPFMRPIPISASAAMIFSLLLALIVVPWAMLKLRHGKDDVTASHLEEGAEQVPDSEADLEVAQGGIFGAYYRKVVSVMLLTPGRAKLALLAVVVFTLLTFLMPYYRLVIFKIMPFDDKQDVQVLFDLPEGSTLEATERVLVDAANLVGDIPQIESMQLYAGAAGPYNFYGLVRQDYMRGLPEQGELRLNLTKKWERERPSHDIAMEVRARLKALDMPDKTSIELVEAPPGPPAPYIMVAEVYGPDPETRRHVARKVRQAFDQVPELTESDDSFGEPAMRLRISIDQENLEFHQVEEGVVYDTLSALLGGLSLGYSHRGDGRNPVPVVVRQPKESLFLSERILSTPISTLTGEIRELGDVVEVTTERASYPIYRRDGHFADMVTASIRGEPKDGPVYAMGDVKRILQDMEWPGGESLEVSFSGQPEDVSKASMLWMGEWDVTNETFTDLSVAFGIALLGIYILVVGQFGSFITPLVVLMPVPLGFSGIIIGHWVMDSTFSMPSTVGLIALSGIVVRNSILLIEFIHAKRREGMPMRKAAIEAGAIRAKPIILTAIAGMAGSAFILPDPMFHGMAVSLIFGLASSTVLTLIVIPGLYVWLRDDGIGISEVS